HFDSAIRSLSQYRTPAEASQRSMAQYAHAKYRNGRAITKVFYSCASCERSLRSLRLDHLIVSPDARKLLRSRPQSRLVPRRPVPLRSRRHYGIPMPKSVENALTPSGHKSLAASFSRLGWIGLWMQIAIGAIPLVLAIYAFIFNTSRGPGT